MGKRTVAEQWELRLSRNGEHVGGATLVMYVLSREPDIARDGLHQAVDEIVARAREDDDGGDGDVESV